MSRKRLTFSQLALYLLGIVILAAGICLNTKTQLGVSPVISVAYNLAQILGLPIGLATFGYYCFLIFLQFLLLRRNFEKIQLLQVVASFLTSLVLQLFDGILPIPETFLGKMLALMIAIVLTGIGASLTIAMQVIPNPADGLANTIGFVCKRSFGFGKNLLDAICIIVALLIGWLFKHSLLGIGLGTVVAMIFTGRVIALCHPFSEKLFQKL